MARSSLTSDHLPLAAPPPSRKCVLGLAASPPSLVLGRSCRSADAHRHELRGCSARSEEMRLAADAAVWCLRHRPWSLVDHGRARTHTIMSCNCAARSASRTKDAAKPQTAAQRPDSCVHDYGPRTAAQRPDGGASRQTPYPQPLAAQRPPLCASAPPRENPHFFFVPWCLGGSTPSLIHHQDTKTPRNAT